MLNSIQQLPGGAADSASSSGRRGAEPFAPART